MNHAARASLTGVPSRTLADVLHRLRRPRGRGRPWALPLERRIVIACTALRTNLTIRELAAVFAISRAQTHRIVVDIIARMAALLPATVELDRRCSWVIDGTLIPTRDHVAAAKSKNYRWSCNAQILVRRRDLRVVAIAAGGPGNRNDPIHYRGSELELLCRGHRRVLADSGYRGIDELVTPRFRGRRMIRDRRWRSHRHRRARAEHVIARLKDWRVLRDHRRRGSCLPQTLRAVAVLHNLKIKLRDFS